jgi:hypothetical protein
MTPPEYGETWVYEGIIGALPGVDLRLRTALAVQFLLFETAVLGVTALYGLPWTAALAGTTAVVVTIVGSAKMVHVARIIRATDVPPSYRQVLLGSGLEVVLAIFAYAALITYLFVFDPGTGGETLVQSIFGGEPGAIGVFVMLILLWDVCYRSSVGWWASVVSLWRSVRFQFDAEVARRLRRADGYTAAYGLVQLAFVPFLLDHPLLLFAVIGHVTAVLLVTAGATLLMHRQERPTR